MRFRLEHIWMFIALLSISSCTTSETDDPASQSSVTTDSAGPGSISTADTLARTPGTNSDKTGSRSSTEDRRIVFLGDSITAGFGVDPDEAFPSLVQNRIDSLSLAFDVVNAGISGDTSTGGLQRLPWLLRNRIDVLVLELGGNDGLRGVDLSVTYRNLSQIVEKTRERYPACQIVLAGMQVPPNLGHTYTNEFRSLFPRLAAKYQIDLIPFLLESVGGEPELNQPDQIHPNVTGHQIVAVTVWKTLLPVLERIGVNSPPPDRDINRSEASPRSE